MHPPSPCAHCGHIHQDAYCSECGQRRLPRFSWTHVKDSFWEVMELERGVLLVIRDVLRQPREAVMRYLSGDTVKYVNPLKMMLLALAAGAILREMAAEPIIKDLENQLLPQTKDNPTAVQVTSDLIAFLRSETLVKVVNLLNLPSFTLAMALVYRRFKMTFVEYLLVFCMVNSVVSIVSLPLQAAILFTVDSKSVIGQVLQLANSLLLMWLMFRSLALIYPSSAKWKAWLKAAAAFGLGTLFTLVFASLLYVIYRAGMSIL